MSNTLDNARGNNPNDNDLDAVFDAMAKEYPQPDIPLQPITPRHDNAASPTNEDSGTPQNAQDNAEATSEQPYQASDKTPPGATCEADAASNESSAPPSRNDGLDLSWADHPGTPPDDVRELPIWGLPTDLQRVVVDVTDGYQSNRDFVVASMFAATATMLGKRVWSVFGNHTNYATLWIAIVGDTASGKTEPLSFIFNPIMALEREAYKRYQNELQQWEMTDAVDRGAEPEYRHNLINNPSDESVLHELSVNESVCWFADELRTMFDGFGKYAKNGGGTIIGNLLSIFNNKDVQITRVTTKPKYLTEPNLNIIGGTQPSILKRMMGNSGFVDDGLFQRFLFVYPDTTDIPQFADVCINDDVREIWNDTIARLSTVNGKVSETDHARQLHIDAINRWRDVCNSQYRNIAAMKSLLRKLEIHLCRWSIVAAVLSGEPCITAEVMRYSIECMDYFRLCGEKAFCLVANESKPKELTNAEVMRLFNSRYPIVNQSKFAEAIGKTQALVSKTINNK